MFNMFNFPGRCLGIFRGGVYIIYIYNIYIYISFFLESIVLTFL